MRLTTFGVGYVGLVTGTGLAEIGHQVLCLDVDAEKVARLERGEIPIYEPGLGDLVKRNERSGRLHFATELTAPYDQSELYFIAVGTPPQPDGSADLRAVFSACEAIAKHEGVLGKRPAEQGSLFGGFSGERPKPKKVLDAEGAIAKATCPQG